MKNLAKERKAAGLLQKDLAKKIGVKQQAISKYENGIAEPDIETQIALADFFNCSIDYLFGRTDIRELPSDVSIRDALKIRQTLEDLEFIKPGENLSNEQLSYLISFLKFNAPVIKNIDKIKFLNDNKK